MYRILLIAILLSNVAVQVVAQELPCIAAKKSMRSAIPGYDNELGAKPPRSQKLLFECLAHFQVCLLLKDGKIVKAQTPAKIHISSPQIMFGLVQTHQGASRHYCTIGSLLTNESGPFWQYQTYAPNGQGAIAESIEDATTLPKTSAALFSQLDKNFQYSITALRREVKNKERSLKELGYLDGERL